MELRGVQVYFKEDTYPLGPLYTTVEKCTSRSIILAQNMVIRGEGWYAGEDEKTLKKCLQS